METNPMYQPAPPHGGALSENGFKPVCYTLGITLSVIYLVFQIFSILPIHSLFNLYFGTESYVAFVSVQTVVLTLLWLSVMILVVMHLRNFNLDRLILFIIMYITLAFVTHFMHYVYTFIFADHAFILRSVFCIIILVLGIYISFSFFTYKKDYVGGLMFMGVAMLFSVVIGFFTSLFYNYWMLTIDSDSFSMSNIGLFFSISQGFLMLANILLTASIIYIFVRGNEYQNNLILHKRSSKNTFI